MKIEQYFRRTYPNSDILFTNSGRAALQAVIEDFNLKDSSIIMPAFICYDVFSLLLKQNNIHPILVDCPKNSFNITLNDIKKQYNKHKNKKEKIKAILITHTFGIINPDTKKIADFCRKNKLALIEDCAHILNLKLSGNAAIFTFNKITNIPIGGCYVKKGKINVKAEKYRINSLDIYRILNSSKIGKLLIKILKKIKMKGKVKVNPEKIEILAVPNFISFFSLKKKFKLVPILVENRDKEFSKLIKQGIRAEKYWTPVFPGCKNAKNFSEKIIVQIV